MTGIVIDASVALAWCFPDEASENAEAMLIALEGKTVHVPPIWSLEITNAVITAERRKHIGPSESSRFAELLEGLTIRDDSLPLTRRMRDVLPLAREHHLFSLCRLVSRSGDS